MNFFDAHNHLQDEWLAAARPQILAELAAAGVRGAVVNGTSEADWPEVAALAQLSPIVRPSFGLHPWDVGNRTPDWQRQLVAALDGTPGSQVGEIGLDRWMLDRAKPDDRRLVGLRRAPIEEQVEAFRWQLALAVERGTAASVHCIDAFGLMHDTLAAVARPQRGFLLHAYSGPAEMVAAFVKLGAYFSFNGSFLDPRKSPRLREVYAAVPLDRLLVETDAPAMRLPADRERFAPMPAPGGQHANHPANVVATYEALAGWRGLDVPVLASQVEENFHRLFG